MNEDVYLDYNATTPVDPRVLQEFIPYLTEIVGNAASEHAAGRRVRNAVEAARSKIAASIGASASTIVFTSGATESINLALKGALLRSKTHRRKVVTFATEHKAVLDTCDWLRSQGMQVDVVAVTRDGIPDLEAASQTIDEQTALVSVMAANNETGVLGPVEDIVSLSHRVGALVHCDATQALGKMQLDVEDLAVDFASISSHKIYGPTGVGALFVRHGKDAGLVPLIHGGGHERGLRSGTLNSAGIVGFGAAAALASSELSADAARIRKLRDALERGVGALWPEAQTIGGQAPRLPNTLNIRLPGVDAQAVLLAMPNVAASTGSACTAASPVPSHVLRAMGLDYQGAQECIRFSLGRFSKIEDVQAALEALSLATDRVARLMVAPG